MHAAPLPSLPMDTTLLRPGLRLAVAVSGGADSVALLRWLAERRAEFGLVLHVAHLHHGLRGLEADADLDFVRALASGLRLPFHESRVEARAEAKATRESVEEAARRVRYGWFRSLMAAGEVEAVTTAHTRDDQAETVLGKFLRGAWTEGLSGIHPVVEFPEGRILRPLLAASRSDVEAYLRRAGQSWREDSTNRDQAYTRNRIRHELLPLLDGWNPRLREHLAQMAVLARDEEHWWQDEIARLAPGILLKGRPVRGGGRTGGEDLALDVVRLAALPPALQRRLLRLAVGSVGVSADFDATETLRALALSGKSGQKRSVSGGLLAERTPRELRITLAPVPENPEGSAEIVAEYSVAVPGEIVASQFGLRLSITLTGPAESGGAKAATLRNWRPGDRVTLRYSGGPRKVKEVLERLRVTGTSRAVWPVLEWEGRIVWMRGVDLEPQPGLSISAAEVGQTPGHRAPKDVAPMS